MAGIVTAHQDGAIRELRVDRSPSDAWNLPTILELVEALVDADDDPGTRVIVISSAGTSFCTGGEIGGPEPGVSVAVHRQRYVEAFVELDRITRTMSTPTIAKVHGVANAGGLAVVALCDVAVAASTVTVATPEIRGGMFPLIAAGILAEHLAPKRALALFYSGEPIDAEMAERLGLLTESVVPELLDERVSWWAARLAAANPRAVSIGRTAYRAIAAAPVEARVPIGGRALLEFLGADQSTPDQSYMFDTRGER